MWLCQNKHMMAHSATERERDGILRYVSKDSHFPLRRFKSCNFCVQNPRYCKPTHQCTYVPWIRIKIRSSCTSIILYMKRTTCLSCMDVYRSAGLPTGMRYVSLHPTKRVFLTHEFRGAPFAQLELGTRLSCCGFSPCHSDSQGSEWSRMYSNCLRVLVCLHWGSFA